MTVHLVLSDQSRFRSSESTCASPSSGCRPGRTCHPWRCRSHDLEAVVGGKRVVALVHSTEPGLSKPQRFMSLVNTSRCASREGPRLPSRRRPRSPLKRRILRTVWPRSSRESPSTRRWDRRRHRHRQRAPLWPGKTVRSRESKSEDVARVPPQLGCHKGQNSGGSNGFWALRRKGGLARPFEKSEHAG